MYKLIIEDDEGKTTVVPLVRDEILIGRKDGNTIRLTERNISRHHAKLLRQSSDVYIEDLGSYNGVQVNGTTIKGRIPLTVGDRIQLGDYTLGLKSESNSKSSQTSTKKRPDTLQIVHKDTTVKGKTAASLLSPTQRPPPRLQLQQKKLLLQQKTWALMRGLSAYQKTSRGSNLSSPKMPLSSAAPMTTILSSTIDRSQDTMHRSQLSEGDTP